MSITPEFIVGNMKLLFRSGWIWYNVSLGISGSCVYSKYSSYSSSCSTMWCSSLALKRGVGALLLSLVLMTDLTFGWWHWNVDLGGPYPDVSMSLLKSCGMKLCLWLIWRSYSLLEFSFMNRLPRKGHISSLTSCFIKIYLTSLLFSPKLRQFSFRYVGKKFLDWW